MGIRVMMPKTATKAEEKEPEPKGGGGCRPRKKPERFNGQNGSKKME